MRTNDFIRSAQRLGIDTQGIVVLDGGTMFAKSSNGRMYLHHDGGWHRLSESVPATIRSNARRLIRYSGQA